MPNSPVEEFLVTGADTKHRILGTPDVQGSRKMGTSEPEPRQIDATVYYRIPGIGWAAVLLRIPEARVPTSLESWFVD